MTDAAIPAKTDVRRWFYHWMALACLAIAVLGFTPTFFLPVAQGTFAREPMVVLHGLLFFTWIGFFATQTWLAASGRVLAHREWGLLGVAIATAMFFSVMTVAIVRLNQPVGRPLALVWADVSAMLYFETCVVVALVNVRRPNTHKRLMLLATLSPLGAAFGRWFFLLLGAPPTFDGPPMNPVFGFLLNVPTHLVVAMMVFALVFDWRTHGRASPAYVIGILVFAANAYLSGLVVVGTPAWAAVVDWLKHMGG